MDCQTQLASLAIEELDKGDFLMATKILTTSIRLNPNNHEFYFERSICHHKLGDYQASLDDANTAIRLNPNDYNIHYQKGLALTGLSMFSEAIRTFKKAIALRASDEESKLSDIFKLLRDASSEVNGARRRAGVMNQQATRGESVQMPVTNRTAPASTGANLNKSGQSSCSNEPVEITTDRPHHLQPGTSSSNLHDVRQQIPHASMTSIDTLIKNGNNNLVATNRNNPVLSNSGQMLNNGGSIGTLRVSSSAGHNNNSNNNGLNMNNIATMNMLPGISGIQTIPQNFGQHYEDQSKSSQFEWNIRRSERIFLHHTNEPGTSGAASQCGILARNGELAVSDAIMASRQRTNSNPSSITSGKSGTKRSYDNSDQQTYQQTKMVNSKDGASSHAESDVDVDDSYTNVPLVTPASTTVVPVNVNDQSNGRKRVMVAPSSSMPATNQEPSASTSSKEDSYSSKYKRLRRDRERARRGTSKLCTIKPSDLEELHKADSDSSKRFMRVIAPIDGWLYSGQLSFDDNSGNNNTKSVLNGASQYVVKLDGDASGSSYLFSQETVLNDVIKEVRVKSVSELRKGARICCYWSRQYKCLSTGVVTSRTFEATKSLVSVKYDNGDLSALPLEDLRLLPPDYPKYMSNCDPLLLARNGVGAHTTTAIMLNNVQQTSNRIVVGCTKQVNQEQPSRPNYVNGGAGINTDNSNLKNGPSNQEAIPVSTVRTTDVENSNVLTKQEKVQEELSLELEKKYEIDQSGHDDDQDVRHADADDEDEQVPRTHETIDFITSETTTLKPQDDNLHEESTECSELVTPITKDTVAITKEAQLSINTSRASSEENNYGIEYRPWMFDGPPRRSKRHGRTYRDNYSVIRRGNEVLRVGDSAELMPRDESILPFIAKIDGLWATGRGEMRVRVRWYYRLVETEGEPFELTDGENALFETDHFDENDVQSIYRSTKILSWTDYNKNNLGHVNKNEDNTPKIFYLAGYYDPVRRIKHLMSDVKEAQ